ncbi:MAG: hypothetical protein U0835_17915 [Isosphaeraceae bacterium]
MAIGLGEKAAANESGRLAATLRLVGVGKLVLAGLMLVLAFTGYDTAKAVNAGALLVGINLLMLGWLCLAMGKSFARASGEPAPPALAAALVQTNRLFGYYLVLILLAVLGVGFGTLTFLARILGR